MITWTIFDEPKHPCEGCEHLDNKTCDGDIDHCVFIPDPASSEEVMDRLEGASNATTTR